MIKSNYSRILDKIYVYISGIRIWYQMVWYEMVPLSSSSWSYHSVWSPPALRLWLALTSRTLSWEQWHCALSRTKLKKGLVSSTFVFWGSLRTVIRNLICLLEGRHKEGTAETKTRKHDCPGTKSRRQYLQCPNRAISYLNFWLPESQK